MSTDTNHLPNHNRKERIDRWFNGSPWKSFLRSRSREIADGELAFFHHELAKTPDDNFKPRQIIGPCLDPVLVEYQKGKFQLGYLCDMDHQLDQVLVDLKIHKKQPEWINSEKVWAHFPANREELALDTPIVAAVRTDSSVPYIFHPAKLLFIDLKCRTSLLYIELINRDRKNRPVRKFVHPHQLRILSAGGDMNDLIKLMQFKPYPWKYKKRAIPLDPLQDAEKIGTQQLFDGMTGYKNTHGERYVMRIQVEKDRVQFFYKEHTEHPLTETELKELVRGAAKNWKDSPEPVRSRVSTASSKNSPRNNEVIPLGELPLVLQQKILGELGDVQSIVGAQRVCRAWYEILQADTSGAHVAIELSRVTSVTNSRKQEQNDGFHQLINILSNTVTDSTLSLTLIGNLNPDLELAIYQFLFAKNITMPRIILKNSTCWRPLTPISRGKKLEFVSLHCLMQVCQSLCFRNVTIPGLFGPIAGVWSSPAKVRTDIDIIIRSATVDCSRNKDSLVQKFLRILNENCPEINALDREHVGAALTNMITTTGHPFRSRLLLMLKILCDAEISQSGSYCFHQQSLSKLAAHAFRYSYPAEVACRSQSPVRAVPKTRSSTFETEGVFAPRHTSPAWSDFNGKFFNQTYY